MGAKDFFKRKYGEETVLKRALKLAGSDALLRSTIEILYVSPYASAEEIAKVLSGAGTPVTVDAVKLRLKPQAEIAINGERARNNKDTEPKEAKEEPVKETSKKNQAKETNEILSIDELEKEALRMVMSAHSGVSLNARLKKVIIFLFKTFSPIVVLCLTIPESYWVFTHIYNNDFSHDSVLPVLTGVFAVLVDFGYLYLTVLLELNKEAMFKRRRAGLEVEGHEKRAVLIQSILWWVVAGMDILAQFLFLYSATHGSTFFDPRLVTTLAGVRVFSLFTTMFVVSFAGTELMTDVDLVANEQVERAEKTGRVLMALGTARHKQMEAKQKLENMVADQDFRREGEAYLKQMYADARDDARRDREELRAKKTGNGSDKKF